MFQNIRAEEECIALHFFCYPNVTNAIYIAIRCYWGYCFESLATEDPGRAYGEEIHHVDANVEFCSVVKTKLGAHRVLMGAEMDCCDETDEGRRIYIELKTTREVCLFMLSFFPAKLLCYFTFFSLPVTFLLFTLCSWMIVP